MSNFNLVLKNANVLTMDGQNPEARWIGIKNGIIEALCHRDDYPRLNHNCSGVRSQYTVTFDL